MKKIIIITMLLMLQSVLAIPAFSQDLELFHQDAHFDFYREDQMDYPLYLEAFNDSYYELCDFFDLEKNHTIKVIVFQNQKQFIEEIWGYYEPRITSVGMGRKEENTIFITSYHDDTTGRDIEEYLKVAKHELTHILFSNEKAWLNEGIALYLANQYREILEYPKNVEDLEVYIDCNIYNKEAYGIYCWLTRFIINKAGLDTYIDFYLDDDNWDIIGYANKKEFCIDAYNTLISSTGGQ